MELYNIGNYVPFRSPRFPNEKPSDRCGYLSSILCQKCLKDSQSRNKHVVLCFPSELDRKELLLKTSAQTLIVGHGEIKMILTGKLPPGWLVLIIEEIVVRASEQEESQQS